MSFTTGDRWVLVGGLLLVVGGVALIAAPPVGPTAPPPRSTAVTECELVQLAVYELDGKPPDDREQKPYHALNDSQQAVFDEGRATNGAFVRFHDSDRMAAADALAPYIVFNDRNYRAHSVRGNCAQQPCYAGLVEPTGYVLASIGILMGSLAAWRRLTY